MKSTKILLFIILVFGICLRFFQVSSLPAILNRDEAALAYNALLLKETGQDEWQNTWPLTFKSFGDYKLPGYPYLLSVLFKILPINDFTTRLPSVVAGSLLILVAFFFARDILQVKKTTALFLSLLVAINPVFFFYSRIAFEANLALLLFVSALYFFFKEKENFFVGTCLMFLAILTYNTPLLLLPFLIPLLIYKIGWRKKEKWWKPVVLLSLLLFWAISNFFVLASQKSAITIFNDSTTWENYAFYRNQFHGFWQGIIGNKYVFYLKLIWQHVLESFSLKFLVQNGGSHPWHVLPGFGHLFYLSYFLAIFMLIDILGEIVIGLNNKIFHKKHLILLYLLIAALAPSVVTVDSPHATRSLFFFFMLLVFAALFFNKLLRIFSKQKTLIVSLAMLILLVESCFYYSQYFLRYPKQQNEILFSDFKNLLFASKKYANQPIAVIDEGGYQYILAAWYLKTPSQDFFSTIKRQGADNINFYYGEQLLNYHFIKNETDKNDQEKIIVTQTSGLINYD